MTKKSPPRWTLRRWSARRSGQLSVEQVLATAVIEPFVQWAMTGGYAPARPVASDMTDAQRLRPALCRRAG
jgi:hypothetical protein